MFRVEFEYRSQGSRTEQLDRFVMSEAGECTIFMMADGYSCDSVHPHYVDWLSEQLEALEASELSCDQAADEINRILAVTTAYPGKASVAFVICDAQRYLFTTLGDTRIYWPTQNRRTQDHSVAQLAVQKGQCPPDQLRTHAFRGKLVQHAGEGRKFTPEWQSRRLRYDECLLLCTDGFWSGLDDKDIFCLVDGLALEQLANRVKNFQPLDNLSIAILKSVPMV